MDNEPPKRLRILVVDDDPIHLKLFELLADKLNVHATLAASCFAAIDAIKVHKSYDLILLDIKMPQVDGFVCAKRIRALLESDRHVPIIAVSAEAEFDEETWKKYTIDDFIPKPFTLDQLRQKINKWMLTE